jgi:3-hydroxyisobutyrate dehydrogenase
MEVGFIGLGVMGRYMAANLLRAGHRVAVFNRTPGPEAELGALGAAVAGSPREAAAGRDAVITIVTDDAAVAAVSEGPQGALAGLAAGSLLIDMSTVLPATARRIAGCAASVGARYLDAPVTGGDVGARDGTLTIMVGGSSGDFEFARPLFAAMGRRLIHVGEVGEGQTMKLVANLISGMNLMVAAEGIALGLRLGLGLDMLDEVLPNSSAQSFEVRKLLDRYGDDMWQPGFSVQNRLKDLRLAVEMAGASGVELPLGPQALGRYEAHAKAGAGELDESSYLRRLLE